MTYRVRWRDDEGVYHVEKFHCLTAATQRACELIVRFPEGDVQLGTRGEGEDSDDAATPEG